MHERCLRQNLRGVLLKRLGKVATCDHCGAVSPQLRKDESGKLFHRRLGSNASRLNSSMRAQFIPAMNFGRARATAASSSVLDRRGDDLSKARSTVPQSGERFLHPLEAHAQLAMLWAREAAMVRAVWFAPSVNDAQCFPNSLTKDAAAQPWRAFFLEALPVPASRFRPPQAVGSAKVEHPKNHCLAKVGLPTRA